MIKIEKPANFCAMINTFHKNKNTRINTGHFSYIIFSVPPHTLTVPSQAGNEVPVTMCIIYPCHTWPEFILCGINNGNKLPHCGCMHVSIHLHKLPAVYVVHSLMHYQFYHCVLFNSFYFLINTDQHCRTCQVQICLHFL